MYELTGKEASLLTRLHLEAELAIRRRKAAIEKILRERDLPLDGWEIDLVEARIVKEQDGQQD